VFREVADFIKGSDFVAAIGGEGDALADEKNSH